MGFRELDYWSTIIFSGIHVVVKYSIIYCEECIPFFPVQQNRKKRTFQKFWGKFDLAKVAEYEKCP